MIPRTDLALETRELAGSGVLEDVIESNYSSGNTVVTNIRITGKKGEKALGKPKGTYITAEFSSLFETFSSDEDIECIAKELSGLLPEDGLILVAGLGNTQITPDALGPRTAQKTLATRHIQGDLARGTGLENLRPVAVIAPGVLGQTGVETGEIIAGLCRTLSPSAVIAIDAMASRRLSRLGRTVQISDSGISPGSGVGNERPRISRETLGIPVISIGIPTVVEAATLAADLLSDTDIKPQYSPESSERAKMVVTPREIDVVIEHSARLLSLAINTALHPRFSVNDFALLMS